LDNGEPRLDGASFMGLLYRAMRQGWELAAGGPLWPGLVVGPQLLSTGRGLVVLFALPGGSWACRWPLCESAFAALMLLSVPVTSEKPLKEFG